VAHALAATTAIERAVDHQLPKNAILIRNLLYGSDILQNHLRHFYILSLLDYVKGPDMPPFIPRYEKGYRLPDKLNEELMKHYIESMDRHRKAHEMVVLFGGRAPHNQGVVPGGATVEPTSGILKIFTSMLSDIRQFIYNQMLYDLEVLSNYYSDYYEIGKNYGHLLTYGMFPKPENEKELHFTDGLIFNGSKEPVDFDEKKIREYAKHSYYTQEDSLPPVNGITRPNYAKEGAYTWIKAPRYNDMPMETGPLARMWISKKYQRGISTMDRIHARVLEAKIVSDLMSEWVDQLEPGKAIYNPISLPRNYEGMGLTEAMRGALGHWLKVRNGKISHYQIVTPSAWNCSPKDDHGVRGPIEDALVGTQLEDIDNPIEVGRIVRAFDPCLSCAIHTITADKEISAYIV